MIPWRRDWLPTPVFWPGRFQGLQSMGSHSQTRLIGFHFHFSPVLALTKHTHLLLLGDPEAPSPDLFSGSLTSWGTCPPSLPFLCFLSMSAAHPRPVSELQATALGCDPEAMPGFPTDTSCHPFSACDVGGTGTGRHSSFLPGTHVPKVKGNTTGSGF